MARPGAAQRRPGTFEARPAGQGRAWLTLKQKRPPSTRPGGRKVRRCAALMRRPYPAARPLCVLPECGRLGAERHAQWRL